MPRLAGLGRAADGPLISVVLAVRGVQEYLPGCLDSILGQPGPPAGIEVIAVDDGSPDNCGAILKAALISHDVYRAYALLAPVNHARVTARRALPGDR